MCLPVWALTLALALAVPVASAQQGGDGEFGAPVILAPPPGGAPGSGSEKNVRPGAAGPSAAPIGDSNRSDDDKIKVGTLGDIDPNSVGLLDEGRGGFGVGMWQGTPADLVQRLLPMLPGGVASRTRHNLARRLLLSAGAAPVPRGKAPRVPLVALRVQRLIALGDVQAAAELLRVVPATLDALVVSRARAETAFLLNDNAGACAQVRGRLKKLAEPFWRRALVFCQLLAGETGAAAIGIGLLEERGVADPAFFALVRRFGGEAGNVPELAAAPDALHIAMMRAARVQLPRSITENATPAVLRTVALSPNAALDTRLDAAERAFEAGLLPSDAVAKLYASLAFPPDEMAKALTSAGKRGGPRARALLFQAAKTQNVLSARAEILARAFELSAAEGRLATASMVFLPVLEAIEPTDALAWFAPAAARPLYLAGKYEKAAAWTTLARSKPFASQAQVPAGNRAGAARARKSEGDAPAGAAIGADVMLWPYATIATVIPPKAAPSMNVGGARQEEGAAAEEGASVPDGAESNFPLVNADGENTTGLGQVVSVETVPLAGVPESKVAGSAFDIAMFRRWLSGHGKDDAKRRAGGAFLLTLLASLGADLPDTAWREVALGGLETASLPAPGLITALERAAHAGRAGETVLLALLALGDRAPGNAHPSAIGPVIAALMRLGFRVEARAMAMEAAFGAGL